MLRGREESDITHLVTGLRFVDITERLTDKNRQDRRGVKNSRSKHFRKCLLKRVLMESKEER